MKKNISQTDKDRIADEMLEWRPTTATFALLAIGMTFAALLWAAPYLATSPDVRFLISVAGSLTAGMLTVLTIRSHVRRQVLRHHDSLLEGWVRWGVRDERDLRQKLVDTDRERALSESLRHSPRLPANVAAALSAGATAAGGTTYYYAPDAASHEAPVIGHEAEDLFHSYHDHTQLHMPLPGSETD